MVAKKPASSPPKTKPKAAKPQLQNLAARPPSLDDALDEQLVDHSGVFRVTTQIAKAQTGHGEERARFASDSLVMAAQQGGFRDEGPTLDEAVEEHTIEDEAQRAAKRARLATLAAQARSRSKR